MYLHQVVVVEDLDNLSEADSNEKKKIVTIEVNGEKYTVSKMEELESDILDAMTVDDYLKFYENESGDKNTDEVIEDDEELGEAMTVEEIMNFYENNLHYTSEINVPNVDDKSEDPINHRKKRKSGKLINNVGLQRSTK